MGSIDILGSGGIGLTPWDRVGSGGDGIWWDLVGSGGTG